MVSDDSDDSTSQQAARQPVSTESLPHNTQRLETAPATTAKVVFSPFQQVNDTSSHAEARSSRYSSPQCYTMPPCTWLHLHWIEGITASSLLFNTRTWMQFYTLSYSTVPYFTPTSLRLAKYSLCLTHPRAPEDRRISRRSSLSDDRVDEVINNLTNMHSMVKLLRDSSVDKPDSSRTWDVSFATFWLSSYMPLLCFTLN